MAMETERQKQTHIIFRFYKVNDRNGDGEGNKMGNGTKIEAEKEIAQAFYASDRLLGQFSHRVAMSRCL